MDKLPRQYVFIDQRRQAVLDHLDDSGKFLEDLAPFTGRAYIQDQREFLRQMAADEFLAMALVPGSMVNRSIRCRVMMFWRTAEARDKFVAEITAAHLERSRSARRAHNRKLNDTRRQERARLAEQRKAQREADKAARSAEAQRKAEERAREMAAAKARRIAEQNQLKAARQAQRAAKLAAQQQAKPAHIPRPSRPGPKQVQQAQMFARIRSVQEREADERAHRFKRADPVIPENVKRTVCPATRAGHQLDVEIQPGGFSSLRPGQYLSEASSCAARACG